MQRQSTRNGVSRVNAGFHVLQMSQVIGTMFMIQWATMAGQMDPVRTVT
jgi:hypothetical protein